MDEPRRQEPPSPSPPSPPEPSSEPKPVWTPPPPKLGLMAEINKGYKPPRK